ncbi:DNA/RNA non-specific endonuclease, partial [Pediococcus acidilactici]
KNLMTGTRSLNSPEMLAHEMDIAYYLKQDPKHYVRYRVTPIFNGDDLLARGVQMEAQSIGDNDIHFNVFIFNVQDGVKLNYADGTSSVEK